MSTLQGLIFLVNKGPRDTQVKSYTKQVNVPAGTTRIINPAAEFGGLARGVLILNRDAANTASVIINNDRANAFVAPVSLGIPINDQWVEQLEVTAGAAGVCSITLEVVPLEELGIA